MTMSQRAQLGPTAIHFRVQSEPIMDLFLILLESLKMFHLEPPFVKTANRLFTGANLVTQINQKLNLEWPRESPMEIPKNKRLISKENLEHIRGLPCVICLKRPAEPEHWQTRGSGGGDELENLNPMCRGHHIEKGTYGVHTFYDKYKLVIKFNRMRLGLPDLKV